MDKHASHDRSNYSINRIEDSLKAMETVNHKNTLGNKKVRK